jgi:hypothetical protein
MAISASKANIYNAYIYALGTNTITAADYRNIQFYITDSNFYPLNNFLYFADINVTVNDITAGNIGGNSTEHNVDIHNVKSNIYPTKYYMSAYDINTFNKDTGLKSENCYEKMTNYPCSSKIFFEETNSWVRDDLDFPEQPVENTKDPIFKYFATEYNFNTAFNKTEYQSYNVDMTPIIEDVTRLSSFQLNLSSNSAMSYGAAGLLLTYKVNSNNEIPMAYYNFGKVYYSTKNTLQLEWHEDGIVKIE